MNSQYAVVDKDVNALLSDNCVQTTVIDIAKESLHFSAAHFTVFSERERERLHGHNYRVYAELACQITGNDMAFDYSLAKNALQKQCQQLDEYLLLPEFSPYLTIDRQGDYYRVRHAEDVMFFLCSDTCLLPVNNITLEGLSRYLLEDFLHRNAPLLHKGIQRLKIGVSAGSSLKAYTQWPAL